MKVKRIKYLLGVFILLAVFSSEVYSYTPIKMRVMEVTGDAVRVREKPTTESPKIIEVYKGDEFLVVGKYKDWYQVRLSNEMKGWIISDYLRTKREKKKKVFAYTPKKYKEVIAKYTPEQGKVVLIARQYLGSRYHWGGTTSRGFDCSGFVRTVYAKAGVNLPHSAREQFKIGRPVSKYELKPGDRVFFSTYRRGPSHVGIYVGGGKFIHASSSRRHRGVTISSLNDGYYSRKFIGARR